ncbi:MAG: TolC family protein [Methylococcales bacterium]|nr:TolC family protein [Methylococcales bacterium]MDD5754867.1 TolC family protein [Methylococcales bacterium]
MRRTNFLLLGLCLATTVHAETLEEAWTAALNTNHQIKTAQANTDVSQEQLQAAEGQNLPDLNVGTGYTQYNETPSAKTSIEGKSAQFAMQQMGSVKAQAMATLPIYTSGRITHNINAAQATLDATQANEHVAALNLKMQVADSYIAVLRLEDAVQVAQSHIQSLESHAKDVKNLFDQGIVAKNDVLAADVELLNAKQSLMQAVNIYDNAKARYNQLLTRQLNAKVELAKKFPESPKTTLENLNQSALNQRPELSVLNEQIEALHEQTKAMKAGLMPQVALNGGYQYQQNRYQAYEGLWQANVGVDWKLFDGSTNHKGEALEKQALALKEQREELSGQILLQVRQAWFDSQETQQRLQVAKQTIVQADENLKVTTDRYQQGLATHTEVIQAEDLRTRTHNNLNNANYDFALAELHLKRASGNF